MEQARDDREGYLPSLLEHLQLTGSEDRTSPSEEVIAARARLTEDISGRLQDTQAEGMINQARLVAYTAALAAQGL
ncbi:hypothetical protein ACFYUV_51080 [Nonomuraea sp. NPDC003560]|uniref:hypothetical protein n=1 Tax=Nonomuraea sp. NPDC003560 TaxID=3364341 RepID=UPI003676FE69